MVVGAFTLAGFISLGVLAVKVSGFDLSAKTGNYTLKAHFENISGLVVRSKVSIGGVIVGQVSSISLDQDTFSALVTMEIDGNVNQLTTDTIAIIYTDGLLGGKYIGLSVGAEDEYLQSGDEIEDTQSAIVLEELIGKFLMKEI